MYKFVIVTDPNAAPGFRLAGVDVFEAANAEEAKGIIISLASKEDIGIIAVNEDMLTTLDDKFRDRIDRIYRPIIIPVPSGEKKADKKSYIERLLRKAIGYNIVMRR